MSLNHSKKISLLPCLWKNCLSQIWSLLLKRLGITVVQYILVAYFIHNYLSLIIPYPNSAFLTFPLLTCNQ